MGGLLLSVSNSVGMGRGVLRASESVNNSSSEKGSSSSGRGVLRARERDVVRSSEEESKETAGMQDDLSAPPLVVIPGVLALSTTSSPSPLVTSSVPSSPPIPAAPNMVSQEKGVSANEPSSSPANRTLCLQSCLVDPPGGNISFAKIALWASRRGLPSPSDSRGDSHSKISKGRSGLDSASRGRVPRVGESASEASSEESSSSSGRGVSTAMDRLRARSPQVAAEVTA